MNEKIIFIRTSSGEDEVRSRTAHLSKDIKRALLMVDGTATVAEIMKRSSPSLRGMLADMFAELARGGFIEDKARVGRSARLITPLAASPKKSADGVDELDFTAAFRVPTQAMLEEEAVKMKLASAAKTEAAERAAAEQKVRLEAEATRTQTEARAEANARALLEEQSEAGAARARAERAHLKAEQEVVEAAARLEAERHAKAAELAVRRAEQQAAEVEARARAVAEEKSKLEAEVAKLKLQAEEEARARAVAEQQARLEADAAAAERRETAARVKTAQQAAEAEARLEVERYAREAALAARKAEQQAAEVAARTRAAVEEKAQLAAEVAKLKQQAEEEARARAVAEQQARLEADAAEAERRETAARVKTAQQAAEAEARLEVERYARETALAARKAEQHAAEVKAEAEARARAVAEEKSKLEAEVARLKAEAEAQARAAAKQEAEAARVKAEQEARRAREEAEQAEHLRVKAEQEAELLKAERLKAEQEAERARAEQETLRIKAERELERLKAEQEAERVRAEQETQRIRAEHEAERLKAEQEVERIRAEQETLRIKAEHEIERLKAEQEVERVKADEKDKAAVQERATLVQEDALLKEPEFLAADVTPRDDTRAPANERRVTAAAVPGCDSRGGNNGVPVVERRTTTAAVLFFDMAGYANEGKQEELKRQFSRLLNDSLAVLGSGERIILDTESGAAVGFLQHPTDALEAATHFRAAQIASKHFDKLRVCIGIHLGPVSLVKDMNGQINMLGDGVNSAQCVMGFAGQNQIYVSRAYFDFVSGLNNEYDELFRYRGSQQDKYGREYQLYELLDGERDAVEMPHTENHLADFNFEAFDTLPVIDPSANPVNARRSSSDADQLLMDSVGLGQMDESKAEPDAVSQEASVPVAESRAVEEQADIYSEAEALQLADAQAVKWAEAAQRAEELARKKVEAAPVFQQPVVAVAKRRRRPVPWGKLAAGLLVLVVAALLVVPVVLPRQVYLANIEHMLGSTLQQPVHIARLSGRILPTPRLVLDEMSIGETRQIQVRQAQVNFSFAALFGAVKPVNSLDLDGVEVKALPEVADWLQQVAGNHQYPVSRINLTQGKLVADGTTFADVAGELDFDAAGKFIQARLNAIGHKLALEIRAAPENKLQLLITLRDSALPLLPNWVFDELKATGELSRDELRIADFDGRIRGGVLTGSARINWRSGWRAQGALVARAIPLQNISKLLSGDLDGTANFQMQSPGLEKLADAAILNGVFSVRKGVVGGVNIVETTRLRSRENLPGGRTYFDELSGELSYANGSYRFSRFQISDSAFKAVGALTVDRQQLSGHVSVDLLMRASSAALQIEGTTESPSLHVAR